MARQQSRKHLSGRNRKLRIDTLEDRTAPAILNYTSTAAGSYSIRFNSGNSRIEILNSTPTVVASDVATNVDSITFNGSAGADTLLADMATGFSKTVTFNGGAADTFTIRPPVGNVTATIDSPFPPTGRIVGTAGTTSFAAIFDNVPTVTYDNPDAGETDTITLGALDLATGLATLNINTGPGADRLNAQGDMLLSATGGNGITYNAGADADTFHYDRSGATTTQNMLMTATTFRNNNEGLLRYTGLEAATLLGGTGHDYFDLSNRDFPTTINGGTGRDSFTVDGQNDGGVSVSVAAGVATVGARNNANYSFALSNMERIAVDGVTLDNSDGYGTGNQASLIRGLRSLATFVGNLSQTEELGKNLPIVDANLAQISGIPAALNYLATQLNSYLTSQRGTNGTDNISYYKPRDYLTGLASPITVADPDNPTLGSIQLRLLAVQMNVLLDQTASNNKRLILRLSLQADRVSNLNLGASQLSSDLGLTFKPGSSASTVQLNSQAFFDFGVDLGRAGESAVVDLNRFDVTASTSGTQQVNNVPAAIGFLGVNASGTIALSSAVNVVFQNPQLPAFMNETHIVPTAPTVDYATAFVIRDANGNIPNVTDTYSAMFDTTIAPGIKFFDNKPVNPTEVAASTYANKIVIAATDFLTKPLQISFQKPNGAAFDELRNFTYLTPESALGLLKQLQGLLTEVSTTNALKKDIPFVAPIDITITDANGQPVRKTLANLGDVLQFGKAFEEDIVQKVTSATLLASAALSTANGVLAANATFTLALNGKTVPVTVLASATSTNTTRADLAADVQAAITSALNANGLASVTATVGLSSQSLRLTFRGTSGFLLTADASTAALGFSNTAQSTPTPLFFDAQGLAALMSASLSEASGQTVTVIPEYDAYSTEGVTTPVRGNELTFRVNWTHTFADVKLPVDFGTAIGDFSGVTGLQPIYVQRNANGEYDVLFTNALGKRDVTAMTVGTSGLNLGTGSVVETVKGNASRDEIQTVKISATGGTFTLTLNGETTTPIAYNADALAVQQALLALPAVRALGALPVTATTTTALTFGAELLPTPQTKLGLIPATAAGVNVDPDVILAAPLATRTVDRVTPSDASSTTSLVINGQRVDLNIPAAPANNIALTMVDRVRFEFLILGYATSTFDLTVTNIASTVVNVTIPGAESVFLASGGNPLAKILENVNSAVASALSAAGLPSDAVRVSFSPFYQLIFTANATGLSVGNADSLGQLFGIPATTVVAGTTAPTYPTLIAEGPVNTKVPGELTASASFELTVGANSQNVVVDKRATLGNSNPLESLADDVQAAVDQAMNITNPNSNNRVRVYVDRNGYLRFQAPQAGGGVVSVLRIDGTNTTARTDLGLGDPQVVTGQKGGRVTLAANNRLDTTIQGELRGDAVFTITIDEDNNKKYTVTVRRGATFDNRNPLDGLVADVQAAVDTEFTGNEKVTVSRIGSTLVFTGPTVVGGTADLSITATATDTAVTELGLGIAQIGTTQAVAKQVARVQAELDRVLLTLGLTPGDVVAYVGDDGRMAFMASSVSVYDLQSPVEVLNTTTTPQDGVLSGPANFDLVLNDATTLKVVVPRVAANANYLPTLTGTALTAGAPTTDGEFIVSLVQRNGTRRTLPITVYSASALPALGFTGRASATGTLTGATALTNAGAKLTADATFRIAVDTTQPAANTPGLDPVYVTLFASETADNTTPRDLVADLNAALNRAGFGDRLFAALDTTNKIVFTAIDPDTAEPNPDVWVTLSPPPYTFGDGSNAQIQAGLQAALIAALTDAGVPTTVLNINVTGARQVRLTATSNGNAIDRVRALKLIVSPVDTEALRQTTSLGFVDGQADSPILKLAQDVQTALNTQLTANGFNANDVLAYALGDITADTARIALGGAKRTGAPIFSLQLKARRTDPTVTNLGFDDFAQTVRPVELVTRARTDNFFVRGVSLDGNVKANATLPVMGTYGYVGIEGTATFGTATNPGVTAGTTITFPDPNGNYPQTKIGELRTLLADGTISDPAKATITHTGQAKADLQVVPSFNFLGSTPLPATFTLGNWAGTETAISIDETGLGDLRLFRTMRQSNVIGALQQVVEYLQGLDDPRLAAELPLIGRSVKDVLDYAGAFDDFVTALDSTTIPNLQAMTAIVKGALGYAQDSNKVAFRLDKNTAGKPALRLDMEFFTGGLQSYSLDLDLEQLFLLSSSPEALDDIKAVLRASSGGEVPYLQLTALNSGGKIDTGMLATLKLSLGFDLSTPLLTGLPLVIPQTSTVANINADEVFTATAAGELQADSTFTLTLTGVRTDNSPVTISVPVTVSQEATAGATNSATLAQKIQAQITAALSTALQEATVVQNPGGPPAFIAKDVVVATGDVSVAEGGLPSIDVSTSATPPATGRAIDLRFVRNLGGQNVGAFLMDGSALTKQVTVNGVLQTSVPVYNITTVQEGTSTPPATDEIQRLFIDATGGTFTLSFNNVESDPIPFNASPAAIAQALRELPSLAAPPNAWKVTFNGAKRRQAIAGAFTADVSQLFNDSGAIPRVLFDTLVPGSSVADEQRLIQVDATGGTFTLSFGGKTTAPLAFNASGADVEAALGAIIGGDTIKIFTRTDAITALAISAAPTDPLVTQLHIAANATSNAQGVIAGTSFTARELGELQGDTVFTLEIRTSDTGDPKVIDVVLRRSQTIGLATTTALAARLQQELNGVLVANGFAANDIVFEERDGRFRLIANPTASIRSLRLLAAQSNPARDELGLGAVQEGTTSITAANVLNTQRAGILSSPATFTLTVVEGASSTLLPITVTPDGFNFDNADMLADVEAAVDAALTLVGKPTSTIMVTLDIAGRLVFTGGAGVTKLRIAASGINPMQSQFGFAGDVTNAAGNLVVGDLRADVQAAVDNALASTSGFRAGDVFVGVETTQSGGIIRFGARNELGLAPVTEGLKTATDAARIQGLAPIRTNRTGILATPGYFDLAVTTAAGTKTLGVLIPADITNRTVADLVADVQTSLNTQLAAQGISGTVVVSSTLAEFTAANVVREAFLVLTGSAAVLSLKATTTQLPPAISVPSSGRLSADVITEVITLATTPSTEPFLYDGATATSGGLQTGGTQFTIETQLVSQGPSVQVTAVPGTTNQFDVEFINGLSLQDVPLLGVDDTGVLNTSTSLGDVAVSLVRDGSNSVNEIQRLTFTNANSGFFVVAFDGETSEHIVVPPTAAGIQRGLVGMDNLGAAFTAVIGPTAFKVKRAEALLDGDGFSDTTANATFTVGVANVDNKAVNVSVDPVVTQATVVGGSALPANGQLAGTASFKITLTRSNPALAPIVLPIAVNANGANTSRAQLIADIQNVINVALAGKQLGAGDVVASLTAANRLRLSGNARDGVMSVTVSDLNTVAASGLGLGSVTTTQGNITRPVMGSGAPIGVANGVLSANASFSLILTTNGDPLAPLTINVNRDTSNTSRAALVADMQTALNAALATRGFAANDVRVGLTASNIVTLTGNPLAGITALRVTTVLGNTARSEIGLPAVGASASDNGLTDLVPDVQAALDAVLLSEGKLAGDIVVNFVPTTGKLTFTPKVGLVAKIANAGDLVLPTNGQLPQALNFTLLLGTGTSDGRHALRTTGEAIADSTLDVQGGVSLDLPMFNVNADETADGLALHMPNLDAFFLSQDPVNPVPLTGSNRVVFTAVPDFSQAEVPIPITNPDDAALALIDDPGLVMDGLEGYFDQLQGNVDAQAGTGQMPLLGDAAKEPLQFVTDLKETTLTRMKDTWSKLLKAPDPIPSVGGSARSGDYTPIKDMYLNPPDRDVEDGLYVSEIIPNSAHRILVENWAHLGRSLNPITTLKNTLYNLFGPQADRVKEYYGVIESRDTVTVGVAWDETQGLKGEPLYTTRQQLLDKYQEHMNDELAKIGFFQIEGLPTVFSEFGPTAEAGEPFYRFTPYIPLGGWTEAQLDGDWNRASSHLHLKNLTSTGAGVVGDPAILIADAAVYSGVSGMLSGLLDGGRTGDGASRTGGYAPINLYVTSSNYDDPVKLILNLSERGVLAHRLQQAIDTAAAGTAVDGMLAVSLNSVGRLNITAGDESDDLIEEMSITPSGAAAFGYTEASTDKRIRMSNTAYPASTSGQSIMQQSGILSTTANFNFSLKLKGVATPLTFTATVTPTTSGIDRPALVEYLQSAIDGALDDEGKAALTVGDITVGLDANNHLTLMGSVGAGVTELRTEIPSRYKVVSSNVILGTTDYTPTPENGVIEKGFDLELELWINTPAPASVFQVAPLRTGKNGFVDVKVSADPTIPNTYQLTFTGGLAGTMPQVEVRTNEDNPLKSVQTDAIGNKTLVDGQIFFMPTATGGYINYIADEGGFDIIITAGGKTYATSFADGDYSEGIEVGASVDDIADAIAGPDTSSDGAYDLLRRQDAQTEDDTGVLSLSEPPPVTDDVVIETEIFKTYESGPRKGFMILPPKLVDNPSISIGLRLGEQNLLERFVKKAAEKNPDNVDDDGSILIGKNKDVRIVPNIPGIGTVILPPAVSVNDSGFGLDLDIGLAAKISWDLNLNFGFSKKEKVFIGTAVENEIKLDLRLGLASNNINGPANFSVKLGPFVATARDQYPTAPYSTFMMDLNLNRYRVQVPVNNYKKNTLLAYTGTSNSPPDDLLTDLNTALKSFLPTVGFGTKDVVAQYRETPLDELERQLSAALEKDITLGTVSVTSPASKTYDITFDGGHFAGQTIEIFTYDDTGLALSSGAKGSLSVSLTTPGGNNVNAVQRLLINADAGSFVLKFGGAESVPIDFDADAIEVQEAINAMSGFRGIPDFLEDDDGVLQPISLRQQALARVVYANQFEIVPNPDANHTPRQTVFAVGMVPAGLQLDPSLTGLLIPDREDDDPTTPAPFPQDKLFRDDSDLLPSGLAFSFAIDIRDPDRNMPSSIPMPTNGVLTQDTKFSIVVKKTRAIAGNAALVGDPTEEFKLADIPLSKSATNGTGTGSGSGTGSAAQTQPNRTLVDLAADIQAAIDAYLNGTRPTTIDAGTWNSITKAVKAGDITVEYNPRTKAFEFSASEEGQDAATRRRRANIREIIVDSDGDRVSMAELVRRPKDVFRVTATGKLNINTQLELSFKRPTEESTNPLMPKVRIDLAVEKPLFNFDTDLRRTLVPVGGPIKNTPPIPTPANGQLEEDLTILLTVTTQGGRTLNLPVTIKIFDTQTPKKNLSDPDGPGDNKDLLDLRDDIQKAIDRVLTENSFSAGAIEVKYDEKLSMLLIVKSPTVRTAISSVSYKLKQGHTKFKNISIDLGSFIGDMAGPILNQIQEIVKPFDWLIGDEGLLVKRLPVISDLNGRDTNLLDLAGMFGQNKTAKALNALKEIRATTKAVKGASVSASGSSLNLGSVTLNQTGGYTQTNGTGANGANRPGTGSGSGSGSGTGSSSGTGSGSGSGKKADPISKPGAAKNFFANTQRGSFDLSFPILTEPRLLFDAIALQKYNDLTLVTLGLPHFEFNFQYEQRFQVFGPLFATLGGFFSASIDVGIGFDMSGVAKYKQTGRIGDIFDGFYISDRQNANGSGFDRPELSFTGGLLIGAELSLGFASAGVQGGITATVDFNLNDPNNDGRVRFSEMKQNIEANENNPLAIFDIGGRIGWFFRAYFEIKGGVFSWSRNLGGGTIFEWTVPFNRLPVLAVQESGGTLILNTGALAANRIHGNVDGDTGDLFTLRSEGANADGSATIVARFGASEVTYSSVRTIQATGGAGDDTYDFSGIAAGNLVVDVAGGAGNDTLRAGSVGTYTFSGDDGNDLLVGGSGNDVLDGGEGDDRIEGRGGNDSIAAGGGNDTVDAGLGGNTIDGGTGNDSLVGATGNDVYVMADDWGDDIVTDGGGFDAFDMRQATAALTFRVSQNGAVQQTTVTDFTSRTVAFDFGIELLLGGRGADKFNIAATGPNGLILDGGRGSDIYNYSLVDLLTPTPIIRDTGPIWNTDTLILDGANTGEQYEVIADTITVQDLSVVGAPRRKIESSGGGIEALEVNAKGGNDIIRVQSTDRDMQYTLNAGEGNDTVSIGVDAATGVERNLRGLSGTAATGPLTVRGNGGRDVINVYNSSETTDTTGALTGSRILGLGMQVGIKYLSFEDLYLKLGTGNDQFTVAGTHASQQQIAGIPGTEVIRTTVIETRAGNDNVLVKTINSSTTIRGGSGDETFYVADDLTTTDQIASPLLIDGETSLTKDILTVDDSEDRTPNEGVLTSTSITGLDMRGRIDYANIEDLTVKLGQAADAFAIQSTNSATRNTVTGGGGNDLLSVSNTSQRLSDVLGALDIDAGVGVNQLVADNRGATTGSRAVLTNAAIIGFAPVPINYKATGGSFDMTTPNPYPGAGVLLRGSTTARDAFFVQSTLGGSRSAVEGNGGNDVYYVAGLPTVAVAGGPDPFPVAGNITNNGDLDTIAGRLKIVNPAALNGGAVYVNDHGATMRANYTVGTGVVQNFPDISNPVLPRVFAGIDYDTGIKTLRVDATDDVNVFDAKPSLTTAITVNANLPVGGVPIVGGGDYLRMDTNGVKTPKLRITSLGHGSWAFSSKHLPLTFESIERFNHVDLIAYQGSKALPSTTTPTIRAYNTETGKQMFAKSVYEGTYRGPIRYTTADMNFDGLPDLITVTGKGRVAEVRIFDGTPDAVGKIYAKQIASFRVLPDNVRVGANLAIGDVNNDGANDVVIGADAGWLPQVSVWDGRTLLTNPTELMPAFMAYPTTFRGGVRVAVGDLDVTTGASTDTGPAEIVVSPGIGMAPMVGIYSFNNGAVDLRRQFMAYPPSFSTAGTYVTIGDYNGDRVRDVIVSAGKGVLPQVRVFSGTTLLQSASTTLDYTWALLGATTSYRGGIRVVPVPKLGGDPFAVEHVTLKYFKGPK